MKVKIGGVKTIAIRGEYIKLDSLLKFASVAGTGGEAKHMIAEGGVFVNGAVTRERGRKVRVGDIVRYGAAVYKIVRGKNNDS